MNRTVFERLCFNLHISTTITCLEFESLDVEIVGSSADVSHADVDILDKLH